MGIFWARTYLGSLHIGRKLANLKVLAIGAHCRVLQRRLLPLPLLLDASEPLLTLPTQPYLFYHSGEFLGHGTVGCSNPPLFVCTSVNPRKVKLPNSSLPQNYLKFLDFPQLDDFFGGAHDVFYSFERYRRYWAVILNGFVVTVDHQESFMGDDSWVWLLEHDAVGDYLFGVLGVDEVVYFWLLLTSSRFRCVWFSSDIWGRLL